MEVKCNYEVLQLKNNPGYIREIILSHTFLQGIGRRSGNGAPQVPAKEILAPVPA